MNFISGPLAPLVVPIHQFLGHRGDQRFLATAIAAAVLGVVIVSLGALVESDTDSFQDVVLVEFPTPGSYSVAFKTAEPPEVITAATAGEGMVTVFMPMGANPVMGGFILHVSDERVYDVDLSVKDGVSSIVSFGVAMDGSDVFDST